MNNLVIAVGAFYVVALIIQALSYSASVKKTMVKVEEETVEANLFTPQNV